MRVISSCRSLHGRMWLLFLSLSLNTALQAQCDAVGGIKGTVQTTSMEDSVSFVVTLSPSCDLVNLGADTHCGITFPGIFAPWSGNTNGTTSTITYTFSVPLTSIDLLIGYTGVVGGVVPETFLFTTDTSTPTVTVDPGSCADWTVSMNETTSPAVTGAFNSIHTISSPVPFTELTITTNSSGATGFGNGGSSFALCNAGLVTSIPVLPLEASISVFPNPMSTLATIRSDRALDRVFVFDGVGRVILDQSFAERDMEQKLDLKDLSEGIYYLELIAGDHRATRQIIVQR